MVDIPDGQGNRRNDDHRDLAVVLHRVVVDSQRDCRVGIPQADTRHDVLHSHRLEVVGMYWSKDRILDAVEGNRRRLHPWEVAYMKVSAHVRSVRCSSLLLDLQDVSVVFMDCTSHK